MKTQREELDAAIAELEQQMEWGAKIIASLNESKTAAE